MNTEVRDTPLTPYQAIAFLRSVANSGERLSSDDNAMLDAVMAQMREAAASAASPAPDLDSDDFRDRHERALRDHILGAVDLHIEHRCDDLCSDAIVSRLLGKHAINEYPWQPASPAPDPLKAALAAVGLPEDESIDALIRHHRNNEAAANGAWKLAYDGIKEKYDALAAASPAPDPGLDGLRTIAERVVAEYDKTHLTHDVAYEDVAAELDQLRLVLAGRDHPGLRPEYRAALEVERSRGLELGVLVKALRNTPCEMSAHIWAPLIVAEYERLAEGSREG